MKNQTHLDHNVDNFCQKNSPTGMAGLSLKFEKITSPTSSGLKLDRCFPNAPGTNPIEDSH